jgi:non-structural maintenance of chromosomes element 4
VVLKEARDRLGPLAIEQKKRAVGKRARFEKNKEDERKPQELREEDIARSENETTKNVIDVSRAGFFPPPLF